MGELCAGCLCADRKMFVIGETEFCELFTQILKEIPVTEISSCMKLCWECVARLRRFHQFKIQVKHCYSLMLWQVPPPHSPYLTSHSQPPLSLPEDIKQESLDPDIKSEDEHWEPETFVNDLSLVEEEKVEVGEEKVEEKKVKITKKTKKKTKTKDKKVKIKKTKAKNNKPLESNENIPEEKITEEKRIEEDLKEDELYDLEVKVIVEKDAKSQSKTKTKELSPPLLEDKPQCVECGKVFSSRKTYRYHCNVLHKGKNHHPCPRCGKVYQWKSNLGRHLRTHKAVDAGELHCTLCDKTFASVATYRQHLRISRRHVTENDFSYTCNECGKKFVNKTRLRDHIDWEHLNKIKFRCHLCNKAYKCHTSLYVHLQNVHRNKEKKDNLCHVCGKSYQNPAKLKYHITALHTGETPYQCVQCSAAFGWYSSLYRHVREVHYKMKLQPKRAKKMKKIENEAPTYLNYNT